MNFINNKTIIEIGFFPIWRIIKPEVCRYSHSIIVNYYYTYVFGKVAESNCMKCTVLLIFWRNIYSLTTVFGKYINVIEYSHLVVSKLKIEEFSYYGLWIYNNAMNCPVQNQLITCNEMDTFSLIAMKLPEKTRAKTLLIFDMKIFIILIINFFVTDEMNKMLLKRIINLLRWKTFMLDYKIKTLIIHKLYIW